MKGIIIEKGRKQSVIMDNSGRFVKARNEKGWSEGNEVSFTSNSTMAAKAISIAAALVIVLTLSLFGVYAANSYTVNLDVNPSISIEMNAFNTVKDITALNDDAEQISNLEELIGLKLGTAVNQAILLLVEEGYLDEDGTVVLSVEGSNNKVRTVTREVSDSIANANIESEQKNAGGNGKTGEDGMNIYIGRITQAIAEAAEEFNLPYGRVLLVNKAIEEGADIDYESAAVLSVREIQRIRNISKTLEKITESENEDKGNADSPGQSKQTEALSKKVYKEAAKIEDYLSELAETINAGEADDDTLAEYAELSDRLEVMYMQLEESGIGTYEEVMNTVMGMTKSKGADAAIKVRVREEVETSLSGGQLGKPDDNKQQNEDNNGKGNEKGTDNGNKPEGDDDKGSDSDSGSDSEAGSDEGNSSSGSDSPGGSGSSGKGGN